MIVIVINNSEMSESSMESCSSEDDISSELRPVEVSKEGSGRGIGREKGSRRGRCIEVAMVNAYTNTQVSGHTREKTNSPGMSPTAY